MAQTRRASAPAPCCAGRRSCSTRRPAQARRRSSRHRRWRHEWTFVLLTYSPARCRSITRGRRVPSISLIDEGWKANRLPARRCPDRAAAGSGPLVETFAALGQVAAQGRHALLEPVAAAKQDPQSDVTVGPAEEGQVYAEQVVRKRQGRRRPATAGTCPLPRR